MSSRNSGANFNEAQNHTVGSEVEFADVVDKLTSVISNVHQLKPWKDRALKAENLNVKLKIKISELTDDLETYMYEVEKWKKRAVRAEEENQLEIQKWRSKAMSGRPFMKDGRDDMLAINLVSECGDDDSTISTHGNEVAGKSFRSKWKNLDIKESNRGSRPTSSDEI